MTFHEPAANESLAVRISKSTELQKNNKKEEKYKVIR